VSEIDEGLISGEQVVLRTNKHWFAPVADSGWAILMLAAVAVLAWLEPAQPSGILSFVWRLVDLVQLGLFLGALGWIVYNIVAWRTAEYGVTTLRIRGHEGLLKKRSTDTLLTSVTDIQSKSSVLGRALGFGNIRIMTASGDTGEDNFTSIKGPDAFKKEVFERKHGAASPSVAAAAAPPTVAVSPPGGAAVAPPVPAQPAVDPMAQIEGLAKLRDSGAISAQEFEAKKADLLSRI
jgi:membrane protein YdbS with pleckstrin-like domain